jgi:hypothetical protein
MLVRNSVSNITRRKLLGYSALAGTGLAMPSILTTARPAGAQSLSASAFAKAKIDWKQFKGEEITVGVIPAGYFNNLIDVAGAFEDLSGIKVHFDKIPPGQIRQKAMLDLSSKTGVCAGCSYVRRDRCLALAAAHARFGPPVQVSVGSCCRWDLRVALRQRSGQG